MRFQVGLRVLLLLITLSFTTLVVAQEREPNSFEVPPITQQTWRPIDVEPAFTIDVASDSCESAATLTLPGGDVTQLTDDFGQSATDPVLDCAWGSPVSASGFRTVWYKFEAPANGRVRINTLKSTYDTILAVYSSTDENDPCENLTMLACDDDSNGFTSEVKLDVAKGITYYIEVADWHQSPPPRPEVWLTVLLEPSPSRWQQESTMPLARSRHAVAVVGDDIYIFGGLTDLSEDEVVVTNRTQRYETDTGNWVDLADMPGSGFAHTTAVHIDGRIYIPFGDNGFNYVGQHWVYDIDGDYWEQREALNEGLSPGWPDGVPYTWAPAVANPDESGYYLLGGLSSQNSINGDVLDHNRTFFYSIAANRWFNSIEDMEALDGNNVLIDLPRYGHMAAWINGEICFVGGLSAGTNNPVVQSNGACYSFGNDQWRFIADLNRARYGAGSAVGPDGLWYVYAGFGVDSSNVLTALSEVEVYNPATDQWTTLPVSYDLGGRITVEDGGIVTIPARGWVRGGFVDGELWAVGGDIPGISEPLSLVEKLSDPPYKAYVPYFNNLSNNRFDTLDEANQLSLNHTEYHNFDNTLDLFDIFYFDLPSRRTVTIEVRHIVSGYDFKLSIHDSNKLLWGSSNNPGGLHESVTLNSLAAGRYYVVVERLLPVSDPDPSIYYQVKVID